MKGLKLKRREFFYADRCPDPYRGLAIEPSFWYYLRVMGNKIFTTISVILYLLALGLLVFGILVMMGKVQ